MRKFFCAVWVVTMVGFTPSIEARATPVCTITGTEGDDEINGTPGDDVICGLGGRDVIDGGAGDDEIYGGAGNDIIYGGPGMDQLYGMGGRDLVYGDEEPNLLYGGPGNDTLVGGDERDFVYGNAGSDRLFGDDERDTLNGGTGQDWIEGGLGDDLMIGGSDHDWFDGGAGRDQVSDLFGPNNCAIEFTEIRRRCSSDNRPSSVSNIRIQNSSLDVSISDRSQILLISGVDLGSGLVTAEITFTGAATGNSFSITVYMWQECRGDEATITDRAWSCRTRGSIFNGRYKMHFKVSSSTVGDDYHVSGITIVDNRSSLTELTSADIAGSDLDRGFTVVNSCLAPTARNRPAGC